MNRETAGHGDDARTDFGEALRRAFGAGRVEAGVSLARYTTFRVGGAADWLVTVQGSEELARAVRLAARAGVELTMLGGGSNVLVADAGVRGLVVRTRGGSLAPVDAERVRADAGVTINALVRWTIVHGLAGLEAWAGTPGTVGGGLYGNAHFEGRLLGDLVEEVALPGRDSEERHAPRARLEFGYDRSRLQRTGEVLLWAAFRVEPGEPASLREIARRSLKYRKRTQPLEMPSAGCIFQNPDSQIDPVPADLPASAGALIDRAGLKGRREGGARVSEVHANFIVNEGRATAADIRRLVEICRGAVLERFGVRLREEIVYLGDWKEAAGRVHPAR
jgi:UDP-N-acetylmuramate dehydrogenase